MRHRVLIIAGCLLWATAIMAGDGAGLYEKKCKVCHSIGGTGGPMAKMGGALDGVGAKRDTAWLTEYVRNPKSKIPDSKMPALKMTDEERDAIVEYLESLK